MKLEQARMGFLGKDAEASLGLFEIQRLRPNACHGKNRAIGKMDEVGILFPVRHLPFVEPVGGYEAAPAFKGFTEGGFLPNRFHSGIDRLREAVSGLASRRTSPPHGAPTHGLATHREGGVDLPRGPVQTGSVRCGRFLGQLAEASGFRLFP